VISRRPERLPEFLDCIEVFSGQRLNFVVMDRHQRTHCGANIRHKRDLGQCRQGKILSIAMGIVAWTSTA